MAQRFGLFCRPLCAARRHWGWDDVLPYFKKAENWQGEASEPHGSDAFLTTSPMSERPAACRAIIAAAEELGLEYRADVNNLPPGAGDSIGWCQQSRGGRRRASAARTYLKPATKRPNLQVITGRWRIGWCSTGREQPASSSRAMAGRGTRSSGLMRRAR